jgi:hypothetical protein
MALAQLLETYEDPSTSVNPAFNIPGCCEFKWGSHLQFTENPPKSPSTPKMDRKPADDINLQNGIQTVSPRLGCTELEAIGKTYCRANIWFDGSTVSIAPDIVAKGEKREMGDERKEEVKLE